MQKLHPGCFSTKRKRPSQAERKQFEGCGVSHTKQNKKSSQSLVGLGCSQRNFPNKYRASGCVPVIPVCSPLSVLPPMNNVKGGL